MTRIRAPVAEVATGVAILNNIVYILHRGSLLDPGGIPMSDGVLPRGIYLEGISQKHQLRSLCALLADMKLTDKELGERLTFVLAGFANSLNAQSRALNYMKIGDAVVGPRNDGMFSLVMDAWQEIKETEQRGEAVQTLVECLEQMNLEE